MLYDVLGIINKLEQVHERAMLTVDPENPKLSPGHFDNYFTKITHTYNTRGNDSSLQIPKIKTEAGRSFIFQGAGIFNKLPKDVRDEQSVI